MITTPDLLGALVSYVQGDSAVTARVGASGVKGGELPRGLSEPPSMIVLAFAGGGSLPFPTLEIGDVRVDAFCYGSTPFEADLTYRTLYPVLKHLTRVVEDGVLIHWVKVSAKGRPERDPSTDFPLVSSSWQVLAAEVAAA